MTQNSNTVFFLQSSRWRF